MSDRLDELRRKYQAAAHAMQSGVATEMNYHEGPTQPKHLRVGVNVALSDMGGLVTLLIAKGLITEEEYLSAITVAMEDEKRKYEERISAHFGRQITLG